MLREFELMRDALTNLLPVVEDSFGTICVSPEMAENLNNSMNKAHAALEAANKAKKTYVLKHYHSENTDTYVFQSEGIPGDWEVCMQLGVDFEPWEDGNEYVEIMPAYDSFDNIPEVNPQHDAHRAYRDARNEAAQLGRLPDGVCVLKKGDFDYVTRVTDWVGEFLNNVPEKWRYHIPSVVRKVAERATSTVVLDRMENLALLFEVKIDTTDMSHSFWRDLSKPKHVSVLTPVYAARMISEALNRSGAGWMLNDKAHESYVLNGSAVTARILLSVNEEGWERHADVIRDAIGQTFKTAPLLSLRETHG